MYEELVAEYLDYQLPDLIERPSCRIDLPSPRQRNLIQTLIGVRRCGKTFCLFQTMKRLMDEGVPRNLLFFFPFDDERLNLEQADVAAKVLGAYYELVPEAEEGCYLFLDEIQDVPGWDGFVRRVAEQHAVTLVITGSSSKLLSTDIPTRLRGRSLPREIWPLDFSEYCLFHQVRAEVNRGAYSPRQARALATAMEGYLVEGGFPAVQGLGQIDRVRLLQTYADEIVTKDVLERFETASFRAGRRFARTALRSSGLKFSVNKQVKSMRSLGISISDAAAYSLLDDFEDAHLVFKVSDYSLSVKDNPKSSYKVYAVDPGLALAVAPANHFDLGQRMETAVFMQLKRRYGQDRDNVIASYSSKACPEVDFVVGDILLESEYTLVQVAAESGFERIPETDETPKKVRSEIGNLQAAMGETGLREGTVVTLSEEGDIDCEQGTIHVMPAWKWFLAEGRQAHEPSPS